ncbi:MAG: cytochrome c [Gammaproteobacteria bacterium]|nr:cytochrome c [Gammaproteobacteria bacterium]
MADIRIARFALGSERAASALRLIRNALDPALSPRKGSRWRFGAGAHACCALGAAMLMAAASADMGNLIDYRKDVMLSMAAHLSALTGLLADEMDFDQSHIEAQATSLGLNAQLISTLFPPGSNAGETAALPAIWQRPEQFLARAEAAEREGRNLVAAAEAGDREFMVQSLKRLADACRNCHRAFRSEGG